MGLPSKDAELRDFATNVDVLVTAAPAQYGLAAADAASIHTYASEFDLKLTAATDPSTRTKVTVAEKNLAKGQLEVILRTYLAIVKANRGVADGDKVALGITLGDQVRTPKPPPVTQPQLQVLVQGTLTHTLRYADVTTPNKRSKPFGVIGMQLFLTTGETTPAGPEATRFYAFVNQQNYMVSFTGAEAGKTAYYYARWQDNKGRVGPWSALTGVVVA
jgi:hypothetical protein